MNYPADDFRFRLADLISAGWQPSEPGQWLEVAVIHAGTCASWRGESCDCEAALQPVTSREFEA
jgi:hypothetical protein